MNLDGIKITPILDSLVLKKIPDSVYFSEQYGDYISNSRLGLLDPNNDGSPEKFFAGLGSNEIFSDALIFGRFTLTTSKCTF